jgi:hypothetical protein
LFSSEKPEYAKGSQRSGSSGVEAYSVEAEFYKLIQVEAMLLEIEKRELRLILSLIMRDFRLLIELIF